MAKRFIVCHRCMYTHCRYKSYLYRVFDQHPHLNGPNESREHVSCSSTPIYLTVHIFYSIVSSTEHSYHPFNNIIKLIPLFFGSCVCARIECIYSRRLCNHSIPIYYFTRSFLTRFFFDEAHGECASSTFD